MHIRRNSTGIIIFENSSKKVDMKRSAIKVLLVILLIFLPVILHQAYRWMTALPDQITIAAGHPEGRYYSMALQLKDLLEEQLGTNVKVIQTKGSLENLALLRGGEADLGFYQPGAEYVLKGFQAAPENADAPKQVESNRICFIANLYSQVVHVIVPVDSDIKKLADLKGHRIALGEQGSGDLAASLPLLKHAQIKLEEITPAYLSYEEIEEQFKQQQLDAAIMTVGIEAPVLHELLDTGKYRILEIPYIEALTRKETHFEEYEIPAGMFRRADLVVPPQDLQTVACGAHLLARESVSDDMVSGVTSIILHQDFSKQLQLNELIEGGNSFARDSQGFPLHAGADHIYNPELKPFLNSEFVEVTEGMRSFIVSMLIASYLLWRQIQKRREKAKEHKLDRYIRQLLAIENKQMKLDGNQHSDGPALQILLDEVTALRQENLKQFSAHELNEDRATDAFLEMCHALSDKINAKLLGWKIDRLGEKINRSPDS
ncbi:alkanesulfonate transporter substrate-binding subunit [Gimesia maris]|uniref:Alkanesulfonate transporter substrate-binding subunit n=2 Tax=Gimesia maris TaxID=122 RepID=A0ABX5YFS5_9PLAN|nr:alkanesulfonate transporter substrate-binding subunit [Gimesia maris]QEG14568.1 alkanesulfonate transporter substrate-binding subunit [Gimesia maris]